MIAVYLAHPLTADTREGIDWNRRNAAKWAAWLWKQGFVVECSWITATGELEETPENRELGLRSDCEQVRRCDVMVLCGPRISGGMLREAGAAKVIVDFTYKGFDLPGDLSWRDGVPTTLEELEKIVSLQGSGSHQSRMGSSRFVVDRRFVPKTEEDLDENQEADFKEPS